MKKKYKILLTVFVIEQIIVSILDLLNIKFKTEITNVIAALCCFLPIQLILYFLSKEETKPDMVKRICKWLFWFITIVLFMVSFLVFGEILFS